MLRRKQYLDDGRAAEIARCLISQKIRNQAALLKKDRHISKLDKMAADA